jgi:hypothetical protein
MLEVYAFQIRLGVGNLAAFASCADNQKRRFARAKLNVFNLANLAIRVEHYATNQIADVIPTWIELCPFTARNLQFASEQSFGIGHRINSRELQNQETLVRPEFLNLQLAPTSVLRESEQPQAYLEPVGNVAMQLDCDFAMASLRFPHARQGDELASYS